MTQERITRRVLPHWYVPGAAHFITYRLAGTIPEVVRLQWKEMHESKLKEPCLEGRTPAEHRERAHKQAFLRYDRYLDDHREIDWLARPPLAAMVRGNLYHHDGVKYHLLAWCIMPNHVHVLLQPREWDTSSPMENTGEEQPDSRSPLSKIMHSLKSYTAHEVNKLLGRTHSFWKHESYDHWVRDENELDRIVDYIAYNPVKAGLVREPQEWFFGSAHDRFLREGIITGWLPP
jgi:putative DNA methylase